jgi:pimeloyl-ACP methyl ester carboxylesterase
VLPPSRRRPPWPAGSAPPGGPRSRAPDSFTTWGFLTDVLDALELSSTDVVANSMGGSGRSRSRSALRLASRAWRSSARPWDSRHGRRSRCSLRCVADPRRFGYRRSLVLGERWAALTTPTLLLWGDRDAFGPPRWGEALAKRRPNVRLVRLAGAGHLPWLDLPQRVVAELEEFLGA